MAEEARPPGRAVDRLVGGYLLLAAAALAFPHRPDAWPILLLVHLALAAGLLSGRAERLRAGSGFLRVLVDWYPLLLMPFLYWELPLLAGSISGGAFYDAGILRWEESIFGGLPSSELAGRWDSVVLSEVLHAAYLSYYPAIYFLPLALYLLGRTVAFRATVFALMLGFVAHYLIFIVVPVQGPRYLFPAPGGQLADGPLYRLTHAVLESGSSRGAAFPSAHAALAAVQTINAIRYLPVAAPLLGAVTIGLSIGAVYGGFHYGIDMVVGLITGILLGLAAPAARRALS